MKIKDMPDWALKYKKKGYTLHQVGDHFGLYRATSKYVRGGNPKTVLTFVGMITEKDGLIPKKVKPDTTTVFVEYGLSNFIYKHFKRTLQRSLYNSGNNDEMIRLAIIHFVFGGLSPVLISNTYLSNTIEDKLIDLSSKLNRDRIVRLSGKISKEFATLISDEEDRIALIALLKLVVVQKGAVYNEVNISYTDEIINILRKYGVEDEKM